MLKRILSSKKKIFCLIICSVFTLCNSAFATNITPRSTLPKLCIDAWNNILNCQPPPSSASTSYGSPVSYNLEQGHHLKHVSLFATQKKSCRVIPSPQQYNDIWQGLENLSDLQFIFNTNSTFNIEMDPEKGQVSEVMLSYQNCW